MTHVPGRRRPQPHLAIPLALVAFALAACSEGTDTAGDPNVQHLPVDSVVLAPGQEVRVDVLRLSFLEVQGDSRCPVDVVCVWQGSAAVEIALAIGTGPSYPFVLNTAAGTPSAEHGGYRVTLLEVRPAPRSTESIRPEDYRAVFRVEAE